MNSENKEQTPKKTAQFVCDYRDEQPTEFLPQLQMHSAEETKEEPSSEPIDNTIPTIHVTLDDSGRKRNSGISNDAGTRRALAGNRRISSLEKK